MPHNGEHQKEHSPDPSGEQAPAMLGPLGFPAFEIVEESMREGMQIENPDIPTDDKVRLLNALSETGLKRIVVGSFVSPKWTPQMADVDRIVEEFTPQSGVTYTALALNERGRQRRREYSPPLSTDVDLPRTNAHLCDVFAQRNTNRTQAEEIESWEPLVEAAKAAGALEAQVRVGAAWGSNWVGGFTHQQRMDMIGRQVHVWEQAGITVTSVFLADPMGWNQPHLVEEDLKNIRQSWPSIKQFHLHLHNTRGVAMASLYGALRTLGDDVTLTFDSSIGGMAGCPYCGNGRAAQLVATEDVVELLEGMGYHTGIDKKALISAVAFAEEIVGHSLYGHTSKAGPRPTNAEDLYPMDMPFIETFEQAAHFLHGPAVYSDCISPWKAPISSKQLTKRRGHTAMS